jgi:hypothetical protein
MSEQRKMKQVWFTSEDVHNLELIARELQTHGVDVEPENGDPSTSYSPTKVIRHLLTQAAKTLDEEDVYIKEQILADLREALHDAITGNTLPASALWDDVDDA